MTPPPINPSKKPTRGQATQLERISTAAWALIGEQPHAGEPITYRLVERGTRREMHTLTAVMVESLEREDWIEVETTTRVTGGPNGGYRRWRYRITREGIQARDRGWL